MDDEEPVFPMSATEALHWINGPEQYDAYDLLRLADPKLISHFKRVDKSIVKLLEAVSQYFPEACFYTASGGFHLMLGPTHDNNENGQQELVAISGSASIGDGDF